MLEEHASLANEFRGHGCGTNAKRANVNMGTLIGVEAGDKIRIGDRQRERYLPSESRGSVLLLYEGESGSVFSFAGVQTGAQ